MIESSQHTSPQHASMLPAAAVSGPPDVEVLRDLIEMTGQLCSVALDDLVLSVSLVRSGEMNEEYVHVLADLAELPPIVVQASSMRVVDGLYRVQAARTRGQNEITTWVVDCDDATAYLAALQANSSHSHGLPLSLQNRKAAAERILEMYPQWSNCEIAKFSGISDKTVAAILRSECSTSEIPRLNTGRDGRLRPNDASEARFRASELFAEALDKSMRSVLCNDDTTDPRRSGLFHMLEIVQIGTPVQFELFLQEFTSAVHEMLDGTGLRHEIVSTTGLFFLGDRVARILRLELVICACRRNDGHFAVVFINDHRCRSAQSSVPRIMSRGPNGARLVWSSRRRSPHAGR